MFSREKTHSSGGKSGISSLLPDLAKSAACVRSQELSDNSRKIPQEWRHATMQVREKRDYPQNPWHGKIHLMLCLFTAVNQTEWENFLPFTHMRNTFSLSKRARRILNWSLYETTFRTLSWKKEHDVFPEFHVWSTSSLLWSLQLSERFGVEIEPISLTCGDIYALHTFVYQLKKFKLEHRVCGLYTVAKSLEEEKPGVQRIWNLRPTPWIQLMMVFSRTRRRKRELTKTVTGIIADTVFGVSKANSIP